MSVAQTTSYPDHSGSRSEERMTFPTTGRRRRIVIVNDRMQRGYQYERIAPTTDPASAERAERYAISIC